MTVSTINSRTVYKGNGSTTAFSTGFEFLDDADIVVTHIVRDANEVVTAQNVLTLGSDYTVSGGDGSTGTITLTSVTPDSTDLLVLEREVAYTQGIDYVPNDPFPAEVAEQGYDRLTYMVQQVRDQVDRALKIDIGSADPPNIPANRANKLLGFDTDGNPRTYSTGSGLDPDASNLNYQADYTGASTVNLRDYLDQRPLIPAMFGVVGDGTTDDESAMQAMIDAIVSAGGGTLDLRGGYTFKVGQLDFTGADNLTILARGSTFRIDDRYSATSTGLKLSNMDDWEFDALDCTSPGGYETGRSRVVAIDGCNRFSGGRISVVYDSQHLPPDNTTGNDLWQLAGDSRTIRISDSSDFNILKLRTEKADIGVRIRDCADWSVGTVEIDTYMKGGRVDGGERGRIGFWQATGQTPTFENHLRENYLDWRKDRPGNNGFLLSDDDSSTYPAVKDFTLGGYLISDSGEHGIRLSGNTDRDTVKLGHGTIRNAGAAGIKCLGSDTTYLRRFTLDKPVVIDCQTNEETKIETAATGVALVEFTFDNSAGTVTISGSYAGGTTMGWPYELGRNINEITFTGTASNNNTYTIDSRDSDTQLSISGATVTDENNVEATGTYTNEGKISHALMLYNVREFTVTDPQAVIENLSNSCEDGINLHDARQGIINGGRINAPLTHGIGIRPNNGGTRNDIGDVVVDGTTIDSAGVAAINWDHDDILLNELVWRIRALDCPIAVKIRDSQGTPGTISSDSEIEVVSSNCTEVVDTDKDVLIRASGDNMTNDSTSTSLKNGSTSQVRDDNMYVLKSGTWTAVA
jgi:hypothetical protein